MIRLSNRLPLWLVLVFVGFCVATSAVVAADTKSPGAKVYPSANYEFTIESYLDGRVLEVYRQAASTTNNSSEKVGDPIFYVEPTLSFLKEDDWEYPWKVDPDPISKKDDLLFTVEIFSNELEKIAAEAAGKYIKSDSSLANKEIKILNWPITDIYITFYNIHDETTALATATNENINSGYQNTAVPIYLRTPSKKLVEDLQTLYLNKKLAVSIEIRYTGQKEISATQISEFTNEQKINLEEEIDAIVERANLGEEQYVFAQTERDIAARITSKFTALVAADDPSLLKHLPKVGTDIMKQAYEETFPVDLSVDNSFAKSVSNYLEPLVSETKKVKSKEDTETVSFEIGNKEQVAEFEKKHKVKLDETKVDRFYTPVEIKSRQIQTLDLNDSRSTFVNFAINLGAFTDKVREDDFEIHRNEYNTSRTKRKNVYLYDVPPGTVLCTFSKKTKAPNGFVWLDGKSKWPNQAWVPREPGTSIVNASEKVLLGSKNIDLLGTITNVPKIDLRHNAENRYTRHPNKQVYGFEMIGIGVRTNTFETSGPRSLSRLRELQITGINSRYKTNWSDPKKSSKEVYIVGNAVALDIPQHSKKTTVHTGHSYIGCKWMVRMD